VSGGGGNAALARAKAKELYADKRFKEAASTLRPFDASRASAMDKVGTLYTEALTPGARGPEAWEKLNRAASFDITAGGGMADAITEAKKKIAPRAATSYIGGKNFEAAARMLQAAQKLGVDNETTRSVKQALEDRANQLLKEAAAEPDAEIKRGKIKQARAIAPDGGAASKKAAQLSES
jgi:hypothetical protein